MEPFPRSFYARDTATVARELLGHLLVRHLDGHRVVCKIVETEAYFGTGDPASHAYRGPTPRSSIMFGPPGRAYVYFTYGMHYMLNAVTEPEGRAGAVLIRALQPMEGVEVMGGYRVVRKVHDLASGPAKLTQALRIDLSLNGTDLTGSELLVSEGQAADDITAGGRVGVSAGKDLLLRFHITGNPFVSKVRLVE